MSSRVAIANLALTKLGTERVTSLSDPGKAARTMAALYDGMRDLELAAHPWNFAQTRAQLSADPTAPAFGWARRFRLPSDCLRVWKVGAEALHPQAIGVYYTAPAIYEAEKARWQQEGGYLLTDDDAPLDVIYIQRVEDETRFSATFIDLLACRLAFEAAEAITNSDSRAKRSAEMYEAAKRTARLQNARETPPQRRAPSSWHLSRYG